MYQRAVELWERQLQKGEPERLRRHTGQVLTTPGFLTIWAVGIVANQLIIGYLIQESLYQGSCYVGFVTHKP